MNLIVQGNLHIAGYFQCAISVHVPAVTELQGELQKK